MIQLTRITGAAVAALIVTVGAGTAHAGTDSADTTTATTTTIAPDVETAEPAVDVSVQIIENETFPEPGIYRGHERWRILIEGLSTVDAGTVFTLTLDFEGGYWATFAGHFYASGDYNDPDVDPDDRPVVDCDAQGGIPAPNTDIECTVDVGAGSADYARVELEAHVLPEDRAPAGPLTFTATADVADDTDTTNNTVSAEPRPLTGRDIDDYITETGFEGCLDIEDECAQNLYTACGWNLQGRCIPATGGEDPDPTTTTIAPAAPTVPPTGQLPDTGSHTAITAAIAGALLAAGLGCRHIVRRHPTS